LKRILENRGLEYRLEAGKIFFYRPKHLHIQNEFDIDRELVDSILNRNVPRSIFVNELLDKLDAE